MTMKDTKNKDRLDLIPGEALRKISKVREYGIEKYLDDHGWKEVPSRDFVTASLRHIYKWLDGEDLDKESGLNHLDHAACSLILAIGKRSSATVEELESAYKEESLSRKTKKTNSEKHKECLLHHTDAWCDAQDWADNGLDCFGGN